MKLRNLGVFVVVVLLLAVACTPAAAPGGATPGAATPGAATPGAESPAPASPGGESPAAPATQGPPATPQTGDSPPEDDLGVVAIPAGEPIHIAFWGVQSGADADLGEDARRGFEIAIDDRGGMLLGREIQWEAEDGLCTVDGGQAAGTKLAADTTLVGLIGSVCSDETVGGKDALTAAGLTTISPSNTRPGLTIPGDEHYAGEFYLRTAHSDAFQGKAVAEFVKNELSLQTAATIHDGSAYAEALQQVFADEFQAIGGEIVLQEAVQKGQTDMKPVLTRVAGASPQALYFPIFTAEGGFIAAQSRDVPGLEDTVLLGSDGMFSEAFVTAAGPNAEGMYLSAPDFSLFPAGYQSFLEKHRAKFGGEPIQAFHAHGYDAANMMFTAIEQVAVQTPDGTLHVPKGALRAALYAMKDFPGITGNLTCSSEGDCGAPVIALYQVTQRELGGEWPPEKVWP
jgi:branched-chain amino acid transport system substrate-binding protein